jgi:RNA recognition motif-containing protein
MKLFVANFDKSVTQEDLNDLFSDYGKVMDVKIWIDWDTGESRGFGIVELEEDWEAEQAIHTLNGKCWRGMRLKVSQARPQRS